MTTIASARTPLACGRLFPASHVWNLCILRACGAVDRRRRAFPRRASLRHTEGQVRGLTCRSRSHLAPVEPELALVGDNRFPPVAMLDIPGHGFSDPGLEVVFGPPPELGFQLARIDEVAAIVVGPVRDVFDPLVGIEILTSRDATHSG